MSLTKGDRRDKLRVQLQVFRAVPALAPDYLDLNIERARDEVYRRYVFTEEHRFRKSTTVNNGDALPGDFMLYANRAYDNSGSKALSLIQPSQIGSRTTNAWDTAQNSSGSIMFANGKVYLFPSGTIGACTMWYYYIQPRMAGSAIPDSTQDYMPADTEDAIIAGAVVRTLQMLVDEKEKFSLDKAQVNSIVDSLKTFQTQYMISQNEDPTLK